MIASSLYGVRHQNQDVWFPFIDEQWNTSTDFAHFLVSQFHADGLEDITQTALAYQKLPSLSPDTPIGTKEAWLEAYLPHLNHPQSFEASFLADLFSLENFNPNFLLHPIGKRINLNNMPHLSDFVDTACLMNLDNQHFEVYLGKSQTIKGKGRYSKKHPHIPSDHYGITLIANLPLSEFVDLNREGQWHLRQFIKAI